MHKTHITPVTAYALAEYFSCPQRAYAFLRFGCVSVRMAAHVREYLRVAQIFVRSRTADNQQFNAQHQNQSQTAADAVAFLCADAQRSAMILRGECTASSGTESPLHSQGRSKELCHAVLSCDGSLYAYVPLCTWNDSLNGWDFHFPAASGGGGDGSVLRQEQKIQAACALYEAGRMEIPVRNLFLYTVVISEKGKS